MIIAQVLRRFVGLILVVAAVALSAHAQGSSDETPLDKAHFASTHNSYAGEIDGHRGSITRQLDGGIRCLELDIHNDDFGKHGYRIGHDEPGDRVFHLDGNPESNKLADWLDMITNWSEQHLTHAPITLYLDLKDKLGGNYDDGNLAHLNDDLRASLGSHLFEARALGPNNWPSVEKLRGKILVVLSGEPANRLSYLHDPGSSPAVAINDSGFIVEVHDSGDGALWYWTGRLHPDRSVEWLRHGRYANGKHPAVTIDSAGNLVEAHQNVDLEDGTMLYMTGRLDSNLEIAWISTESVPPPGNFRAINPSTAYFNNRRDTIVVSTGKFGPFDDNTLLYRINSGDWQPVRYSQVAFWEFSDGMHEDLLILNPRFVAADAKDSNARSRAERIASTSRLVRLWRFDNSTYTAGLPVNFPSTDFPYVTWYTDYCRRISCVD